MPVGMRLKFDGGTQAQYDAIHSGLGIDEDPPDGLIFHSAGPIEAGWGVIDVWESRGQFDRFIEGRLVPRLKEAGSEGFQAPPDIKEFPVHHYTKP